MTGVVDLAGSLPRRAARASKPAVRRAWRLALRARAMDETAGAAGRSAVVVAPHPDDETLGCGALIARKRAAGTRVVVVIVTDGRHSHRSAVIPPDELAAIRAGEARAACARLGVAPDDLHLLGLEEGTAAARQSEVARRIAEIVADVGPDDVLTTSRADWHADHRAASAATAAGVVAATGRRRVLEFPIWFWVDGPWAAAADGRGAVRRYLGDPVKAALLRPTSVRTGAHLATKRAALAEYRSQTTNLTGESTWAVMDDDLLSLFLAPVELFLPAGPPTVGEP